MQRKTGLIEIKDAGKNTKVTDYLTYVDYIKAIYDYMKKNRDKYSFLQLSIDLTLGNSNMVHLCVTGKRHLSYSSIQKMSDVLMLKGVDRLYLETMHKYNITRPIEQRDKLFQRLMQVKERSLSTTKDKETLEYYSEWLHPVVRELATVPELKGDPSLIAAQVTPAVTPEQVRKSLSLLIKNHLITLGEDQQAYVQTTDVMLSGHDLESHSLVSFHQQTLSLAKDAVTGFSSEDREFGALTMLASEGILPLLKKEVREFQNRIIELVSKDTGTQRVIQLNVHCFPLSKPLKTHGSKSKNSKKQLEESIHTERSSQ